MPSPLPLEIDVQTAKSLLDSPEACLLLDCREQDEYDLVHLEGSFHLPMGQSPERLAELEPYREQRIAVLCHHGMRSLQVAQYLQQQGFSQTQSISGGIEQWSVEIDTSLARY